ncbi:hypothetical protein [Spirosoma endbachense]|uniref:Uncharacterized protein n=1 Tax=Spirosoma endbachense TaxID=2666025 RepID=A0A6P1VMF3_9BACT|nr:hypothetical protein [Spirosoma endbachense]QHV94461.1 hypothetical protein GJR95_05250 [Spirosoma endbachense]
MKKINGLMLAILGLVVSNACLGQHSFSTCSAAFLNNKMVVDSYTDKGKCLLSSSATGQLTLQTVSLSPTGSKGLEKVPFRVAIKDKATQTLLLLTQEEVKEIDVKKVLAKCKKGDRVILLTLDDQYAVPHNEILVQ